MPFFLRTRCALKPVDFKKIRLRTSVFLAFGFFSSPLRGAKPCFLPLFSIMAKTLQQAKSSKKCCCVHLRPPRADVAEKYDENVPKKFRESFPLHFAFKSAIFQAIPPSAPTTLKFRGNNFQDTEKKNFPNYIYT
jgi:hypothetical protein